MKNISMNDGQIFWIFFEFLICFWSRFLRRLDVSWVRKAILRDLIG